MAGKLSYEESCVLLQKLHLLDEGEIPLLPYGLPNLQDERKGVRFVGKIVTDARLENLTLPHTLFSRSEFRATSFKGSNFSESKANWNDFIDVDFTSADLSGSDFRGCLFEGVRFKGAGLNGADLRYCGFRRCDFTDADMTDVKVTRKVGAALRLSPEQQSLIDWQTEDGEEPEGA